MVGLCTIVLAMMLLAACNPNAAPDNEASSAIPAPEPAPPAPAVQSPDQQPVLTLPGRFAADTTVTSLEQQFGKTHVRIEPIPGGEGTTLRGVVLYPDDASRRAYLYFQDEKTLHGLHMVRIIDPNSMWTVDPGIRIGMPLPELLRINGKPIKFTGFDWDYGGGVSDWNDGALAPRDGEMTRRMVRMDLPQQARGDTPHEDLPIGDGEFASDDPRFADLQAVVSEIGMSFPGEDDL